MADSVRNKTSREHGRHLGQRFNDLNDLQTVAHFKVCVVGAQMEANENIIGLIDRQMVLLDAQSFACANTSRDGLFRVNPNYCPPERIAEIGKGIAADHAALRAAIEKTRPLALDFPFGWVIEIDGEESIDNHIFLNSKKAQIKSQNKSLSALFNFIGRVENGARNRDAVCRATLRKIASDIRIGIMDERHTVECGDQILWTNASIERGESVENIINKVDGMEAFRGPNPKPDAMVNYFINVNTPSHAPTVRTSTHRTPHRARRASPGHGASAKSGDDGDGDGDGDGEPPRPRFHHQIPASTLRYSLTHSQIFVGGAQ
jgi:hypothetical protein